MSDDMENILDDIIEVQRERDVLKGILGLIASGGVYGDNCRTLANTTLNELYKRKLQPSDASE